MDDGEEPIETIAREIAITESARLQWVPLSGVPDLIAESGIRNSGTLIAPMQVLLLSRQKGYR